MGKVRKRGKNYFIDIRVGGKKYRKMSVRRGKIAETGACRNDHVLRAGRGDCALCQATACHLDEHTDLVGEIPDVFILDTSFGNEVHSLLLPCPCDCARSRGCYSRAVDSVDLLESIESVHVVENDIEVSTTGFL